MISIQNVSKFYGSFQVLTDCSTEVRKGEVIVVCGPSGSGKSTPLSAFASVSEATDFLRLQGLSTDSWQIYQVSGDYQLDVSDGVLNKTLQLVRPLPFSH